MNIYHKEVDQYWLAKASIDNLLSDGKTDGNSTRAHPALSILINSWKFAAKLDCLLDSAHLHKEVDLREQSQALFCRHVSLTVFESGH